MAFTDITAPANWEAPFTTYWDGSKYVVPWETAHYQINPKDYLAIPGYLLKLTLNITEIGVYNFGEYLILSLTHPEACASGTCRLPPVVGNDFVIEKDVVSGSLSTFYLYDAHCRIQITKIEMWDGADPYFWTNFIGETEVI